jgi:hypothetical protein
MSDRIEYKKAGDWLIGEELREHAGDKSFGTIISIRNCSRRPTMAFMVVLDQEFTFTIYNVLRDARSSPIIARRIPGDVLMFIGEDIRIYLEEHKKAIAAAPVAPVETIPAPKVEYVSPCISKSDDDEKTLYAVKPTKPEPVQEPIAPIPAKASLPPVWPVSKPVKDMIQDPPAEKSSGDFMSEEWFFGKIS